jgi:putative flippase GtrA
MFTYLKAQAALIVGSLADYLVTIVLVEVFHSWYLVANLLGNISGAVMQFVLSRNWAFEATGGRVRKQVTRFILVWAGNLALSAAGVYFFTQYIGLSYIVSKVITSVTLGLTYNYILQKRFVFS